MESSTKSRPASLLRTIVFASLAATTLLSLALGLSLPGKGSYKRQKAEMYRRSGDTYVRMFYLARAGGWEQGGTRFLHHSKYHYQVSAAADASDVRSAVSLALVLDALGEERDAETLLAALRRPSTSRPGGSDVAYTYAILRSTQPRREYIEAAADFLRGLPPGRMTLAEAYQRIGEQERADEEWRAAEAEGLSLLSRIMPMLAVCGAMLALGLIGALVAIILRLLRWAAGPAAAEERASAPAGWGMREAVEALILWLFVLLMGGAAASAMLPADGQHAVLYQLAPPIVAGVAAIAWVLVASPAGTRLGWRGACWWRRVAVGVSAAGLAALPVLAIYQFLQDMQLRQFYAHAQNLPVRLPEEHPLLPMFVAEQGLWARVAFIVAACVVVPIIEETLFRGVLYRALRRQWSFAPAAFASAAIFAVAHLLWIGLVPYLLLGLLFAYLYERSGSLLAPWAAHGAFNGFNLAILLALCG